MLWNAWIVGICQNIAWLSMPSNTSTRQFVVSGREMSSPPLRQ